MERVDFTAEEFEIPTPPNMSVATSVINRYLWERISLNSKRDFA
jgi:hypothetical protein